MEKFIIIMWLCTATTSTPLNCKPLKAEQIKFADQYNCTVYGYSHSLKIIKDLGKDQINQYNLFTKFVCVPEKYMKKKESNV